MTRYKFWSLPKKGKNMNWQKSKDKVLPVWQAQEKQQSVSVCGQPTLRFQAGEKILFFEQVNQSKRTPPTSTTQLCHLPLLSATEERNFSNQEGIFEKTSEGKFSRQRISEKISTCQQITRSLCKCLNVNLNFCETLKLIFQFNFDPQDPYRFNGWDWTLCLFNACCNNAQCVHCAVFIHTDFFLTYTHFIAKQYFYWIYQVWG